MNLIRISLLTLSFFIITGCATPNPDRLNSFHAAQLRSVLIVPPLNEVTDIQATTSVLATLPYFLAEKGFYVFPVNTVKTLLELEGYYEPAEVHAAPPEQLAALFHADSVLYLTIHEWTSRYLVFNTTTEVDFGYKLVAADGALLWEERRRAVYTPNNNNGGGLGGLIVSAIQAAAERANPTYIPLTKTVHSQVFVTPSSQNAGAGIPLGPYHPRYEAYYKQINSK